MKRTPKSSDETSEQSPSPKKSKKTPAENAPKGRGLFDHIKHIQSVQDPDYFDTLTELDLKSFNQFMILRALSMNPELLDDVAMMYRYLDVIPDRHFYKVLIAIVPLDRTYYKWAKAKKRPFGIPLLKLVSSWFEVSMTEAEEYATILSLTEKGNQELFNICQGFGLTDKEIEKTLTSKDDE